MYTNDQIFTKQLNKASYLYAFGLLLQIVLQIDKNAIKDNLTIKNAIVSALVITSLLITILHKKTSYILVFALFITINLHNDHGKICYALLTMAIIYDIYNILNINYLKTDYDLFRLINLRDISQEILPILLISSAMFSILSLVIEKLLDDYIEISFMKFFIFILLTSQIAFRIYQGKIKTIFPAYSILFILLTVIAQVVYLDIRYAPNEPAETETKQIADIMATSFFRRNTIKFAAASTSVCESYDKFNNILKEFRTLGIYVSTESTESDMISSVAFFPHITVDNIDKFINSHMPHNEGNLSYSDLIKENLIKFQQSYKQNWIIIAYDEFDKYCYKLYEKVCSIEMDKNQNINFTIMLSAIAMIFIVLLIVLNLVTSTCVTAILVHMFYISYVRHKFMNYNGDFCDLQMMNEQRKQQNPNMMNALKQMLENKNPDMMNKGMFRDIE